MPPVVRHAPMAKSRHDETSTGADKTVVTIRVFCRLCHKKLYKQVKSTYPQRASSVAAAGGEQQTAAFLSITTTLSEARFPVIAKTGL